MPNGIIKLILSENSPHSARYRWNIAIHTIAAVNQMNAPIPDIIVSEIIKLKYESSMNAPVKTNLTISDGFVLFVQFSPAPERNVEEPAEVDRPHKW